MTSLHVPMRPHWQCVICEVPWPCHTKQAQLLAEYDGTLVSLSLLMSMYFVDAATDLRTVSCAQAYVQFFGWLPYPPASRYATGPFSPIGVANDGRR